MGNFNNVTMGTGTLEIDNVDVGFLKGDVNYKYSYDIEDFKTGVPKMLRGSITKEVTCELTAPIAEITAGNIAMMLGGLTPSETSASEVDLTSTFAEFTFALAPFTKTGGIESIKLGPVNNRDLKVTISDDASLVIKDSTEATTYTEGTDYLVDYKTGYVFRNPDGGISSGEAVKVKFKYTPPAAKQLNLGATFSLSEVKVKFTHTSPITGKDITVVMWKANASGNAELGFKEDNYVVNNVTFKGVYDSSHLTNPLGYIHFET